MYYTRLILPLHSKFKATLSQMMLCCDCKPEYKHFIEVPISYLVTRDTSTFDWWNWWKNTTTTNPTELWKNWTAGWRNWVSDQAKTYVSTPIELQVKVNSVFRGREPSPEVDTHYLYSRDLPKDLNIYRKIGLA